MNPSVCASCASKSRRAKRLEWLVNVLSVMPVTFPELFTLRVLDSQWNDAVNIILSLYRGLQYKLPCQEYSDIEFNFLRSHFSEFAFHTPWQVHTLCAVRSRNMLQYFPPKINSFCRLSCRQLLCSRTCKRSMTVQDIIRVGLCKCLEHPEVAKSVITAWNSFEIRVHQKMMFWWVYLCRLNGAVLQRGLLRICCKNLHLIFLLWFECNIQRDITTSKMQKYLCTICLWN